MPNKIYHSPFVGLPLVIALHILAAMALPAYFKAVERSRIAEADTLLGSTAQAQQRRWMKNNSYSAKFSGLDVAPTNVATHIFCTKGGTSAEATDDTACANGFSITLDQTADNLKAHNAAYATAKRVGNDQYDYELKRYYNSTYTTCKGGNEASKALCADYCGTDDVDDDGACCNSGTEAACAKPTDSI